MTVTKGERIRKERIKAGLTQKQLGRLSGIAEPTIRRYELGMLNPKLETLQRIANALDIDYMILLRTDGKKRPLTTGEKILYYRLKAGLSQQDVGNRLGVTYQSVAQYERGTRNPKISTLKKIAEAIGVDYHVFLDADMKHPELEEKTTMGMTIYEIDARIAALDNAAEDDMLIDEETGELMTVAQALDALHMAREEKIEGVACWVKNLAAEAKAIDKEEENLAKRRKAAETKAARLRSWLISALTREDGTTDKVKTARVSVSVKKNPPSTVVDEALLPNSYKVVKITYQPDKDLIKRELLAGGEVPGAHLEYGRSVMIK